MSDDQSFLGGSRSLSAGTWERLCQVAVKAAEYDSPTRQLHPKCLEGTRVTLLKNIYQLLDNRKMSQLIWLHGMAGVGKSAVAFTVAERMRNLKVTEQTKTETRLAGTFFFSRKLTKCSITGYFFATLAYQLACNFPCVREDLNRAIRENHALLGPDESLRRQMEGLFLKPLRKLQIRLRECPPSTFVIDAVDECISQDHLARLISLLNQALHEPDLPVIHILLTSRSETYIRLKNTELRPLVSEIPAGIFGESTVTTIISLDDAADVDDDIRKFLEHSFEEKSYSGFPTVDEIAQLASRAGKRFIVASTMVKFIDDEYQDPRDRLQVMLRFTNELLPDNEVYKLYNCILATCANPTRAYLHLSVVAALADPLPIRQISELLGHGEGKDVEITLAQLRSIIDIPTDSSLPVNICHSSVRDYVSDPSNCDFIEVQDDRYTHSILAHSSFRLMRREITSNTDFRDALSELSKQSQAMQPRDPKYLKRSLAFIVEPPEPLQVLMGLLWTRGDQRPALRSWPLSRDGTAWLQDVKGDDWLRTLEGKRWLETKWGLCWLETSCGADWLGNQGGEDWLQTEWGNKWLQTAGGKYWLQTLRGKCWLQTKSEHNRLHTRNVQDSLQSQDQDCSLIDEQDCWLIEKRAFLLTLEKPWLQCLADDWQKHAQEGQEWLFTEREDWLHQRAKDFLQTQVGKDWLQTQDGQDWLCSNSGQDWLCSNSGQDWRQTLTDRDWLHLTTGHDWPPTELHTESPQESLRTVTQSVPSRLQTKNEQRWLQTEEGGDWLQTCKGREWLQAYHGRGWLQTESGRDWLQTQNGQGWLQTPDGRAWQLTLPASVWLTIEEFSSTLEAIDKLMVAPEMHLLPVFPVIQQFRSLPDFLMFPVFLALRRQNHSSAALPLPQGYCLPDMDIIHAMKAFVDFAKAERERSTSDALKYACQNWVFHLSRAHPWNDELNRIFKIFWNSHLLSWFERQWSLKGLPSCLRILSEGQKNAKCVENRTKRRMEGALDVGPGTRTIKRRLAENHSCYISH